VLQADVPSVDAATARIRAHNAAGASLLYGVVVDNVNVTLAL
jgi:hypothetical protein